MMIQLPPKIWKAKPGNRYVPVDYNNDTDEGLFDFLHHGNTVYCPKEKWSDKLRDGKLSFNPEDGMAELMKNLHIGENIKELYKDN